MFVARHCLRRGLLPANSQSNAFRSRIVGSNNINKVDYDGLSLLSQMKMSFASSKSSVIKELRSLTGAPMMECKKALDAVSSDSADDDLLSNATEWLRKNGSAKALSKVSGRDASEGLVGIHISPNHKSASIIKVSSETDFASRSDVFSSLVQIVAQASLNSNADDDGKVNIDQLLATNVTNADTTTNTTVKDFLEEAILAIRENLSISEATVVQSSDENSILVGYVHGKVKDNAGTSASLVQISGPLSTEEMQEIGKKLAMHIVAAKPTYLSPEHVPDDIVDREKAILKEQLADSGKPDNILDKIVQGRMRKFYEGICLTEQAHLVEEGNPKIAKSLEESKVSLQSFQYISIAP